MEIRSSLSWHHQWLVDVSWTLLFSVVSEVLEGNKSSPIIVFTDVLQY